MKENEVMAKLNSIFQRVFLDDSLIIQRATCAEDIKEWDSLMHITLITSIENEFGLQFSLDDVLRLKNVGDMVDLIIRGKNNA